MTNPPHTLNITHITTTWNTSLKQQDCKQQMIYLIGVSPFMQQGYQLKTFNGLRRKLAPGEYRISLQYIAKEHSVSVKVELNDTTIQDTLTYGKFLYFKVTSDFKIIPGTEELFKKFFMERRINNNKQKIEFWNTYWKFLHTMTHCYPSEPSERNKNDVLQLVANMKNGGLTCQKCLIHFRKYTSEHPITPALESRTKLFDYFFNLHNDVNERNKKPIFKKEDAYKMYTTTNATIKRDFNIDVEKLVKEHKIYTIPNIVNKTILTILKKKYNLI